MKETTSDRLKKLMQEKGLKQSDIIRLARPYCEKYHVKLNSSDMSQFCTGKVTPGQRKLTIIAMALNVSEAWLMGLDVPIGRSEVEEPEDYSDMYTQQQYRILEMMNRMSEEQIKLFTKIGEDILSN